MKNMENDRRKEVINICLDHFIEKGLVETSTRSLSKALKLQNAGLYYYFSSKDEAVVLCADEAAVRIEKALIEPAIQELQNPECMMKRLKERADKMAPTMRFLVSVCANRQYRLEMKPALDRLSHRYTFYAQKVAQKLNCKLEEIEPYVYMTITAITNYMIFEEENFIIPQIQIVEEAVSRILQSGGNVV